MMKQLPETRDPLVLRTDFSDDTMWESVCADIKKPVGDFKAYVDFISDPQYDHITITQILSFIPKDYNHTFIFLVDLITIAHPDHPILVVDLYKEPGRTFRVFSYAMWGVENNLSIGNMSFEEFISAVDEKGIFRGFPES